MPEKCSGSRRATPEPRRPRSALTRSRAPTRRSTRPSKKNAAWSSDPPQLPPPHPRYARGRRAKPPPAGGSPALFPPTRDTEGFRQTQKSGQGAIWEPALSGATVDAGVSLQEAFVHEMPPQRDVIVVERFQELVDLSFG